MQARLIAIAVVSGGTTAVSAQPAPTAAKDPVQSLSPVFVTGSPLGSNLFELADPVNVLQGRDLVLKQQPTLGATLEQQVGVSATNFGPNASRPVIRGFGNFDVRLLSNGLGVLDASAASPDHAVAISPFAVERIEVVRGPATVMYGGSALGGVVNTIDSRIAQSAPAQPVSGAASYRYDGQNALSAGGARIDGGNDRVALHADLYATRNGDLRIPGAAWTGALQAERGEPGPTGRLPNSQGDSQTLGLGASVLLPREGYAGVSYSQFSTRYGTVAEPTVTIDLEQHAWNFASELSDPLPGLATLRIKLAYGDYTHTEFDSGVAGTTFASTGWNLRLEALHRPLGALRGALGLEAARVDFSAVGDEAFVPSTTTQSAALFAFEELTRGAWRFSFGGRLESVRIDAAAFAAAGQPAAQATFTPWSLAADALLTLAPSWNLGAGVSVVQRAPSAQELYANGPHLATNQFEVGNPALASASSTSLDLTLKRQGSGVTTTLSAFYADFTRFIGLFPTGIWRSPADRSVTPGPAPYIDAATGDLVTPIEQYDYLQVPARFYGFEAQLGLPLWQGDAGTLSLALQADYVNATNRSNGQPLPFIPPLRVGATLSYQRGPFTAGLSALAAAQQNRVPQYQTSTPGYINVTANASYKLALAGERELELFLQATNLLNDTIRSSTSPLKDIAPAGARALMAGVRGAF